MSRLTVHAKKIRQLTCSKQHIASIAWELDFYAIQHLSASAYKVWHVIRAFAAFDTQCYSTKLSQEFLANKIGCSTKTISRAISEIKKAGLLKVQNNTSIKTGTGVNTYFITFPEEAYEQAEAKTDKVVTSPLPSMTIDVQAALKPQKTATENKAIELDQSSQNRPTSPTNAQDNIDHTPLDKTDVHNREFIFREKNNKHVVVNFSETKNENKPEVQKQKLSHELTQLEKKEQALQQELNNLTHTIPVTDRLSLLKKALNNPKELETNDITSKKASLLRQQLDEVSRAKASLSKQYTAINTRLKQQQRKKELSDNVNCINQLEGQRQLSESDMALILTKLSRLGLSIERRNQLVNEIVYEARFGSLVKNNQTQHDNPMKRSINIGCKLVKEGQWCTPTNYSNIYQ